MKLEAEDIPRWIKKQRLVKKLSIMSLSKATGVTRSTLSAIETGDRKPSLQTFMLILDGLGYEISINKKGTK